MTVGEWISTFRSRLSLHSAGSSSRSRAREQPDELHRVSFERGPGQFRDGSLDWFRTGLGVPAKCSCCPLGNISSPRRDWRAVDGCGSGPPSRTAVGGWLPCCNAAGCAVETPPTHLFKGQVPSQGRQGSGFVRLVLVLARRRRRRRSFRSCLLGYRSAQPSAH